MKLLQVCLLLVVVGLLVPCLLTALASFSSVSLKKKDHLRFELTLQMLPVTGHRCHLWRTLATSKTLGALGGQKQCRHLDHDVMAMHTTVTLTDLNVPFCLPKLITFLNQQPRVYHKPGVKSLVKWLNHSITSWLNTSAEYCK